MENNQSYFGGICEGIKSLATGLKDKSFCLSLYPSAPFIIIINFHIPFLDAATIYNTFPFHNAAHYILALRFH